MPEGNEKNYTAWIIGVVLTGGVAFLAWYFLAGEGSKMVARAYGQLTSDWSDKKYQWFKKRIINDYAQWAYDNPWKNLEQVAALKYYKDHKSNGKGADVTDEDIRLAKGDEATASKIIDEKISEGSPITWAKNNATGKFRNKLKQTAREDAEFMFRTGKLADYFTGPERIADWKQYANNQGLTEKGFPAKSS